MPSSDTNADRSLSSLRLQSAILRRRLGPVVPRLDRSIAETTAVCMYNWSAVADQWIVAYRNGLPSSMKLARMCHGERSHHRD